MEQILPFSLEGGIYNYQEKSESSPLSVLTLLLKCLETFLIQKQLIFMSFNHNLSGFLLSFETVHCAAEPWGEPLGQNEQM